jgi:TolB-like protein
MGENHESCAIRLVIRGCFCIMSDSGKFHLELIGPFRLFAPDGQRIEIASKRGMALVALLAMSPGGERARAWLQDLLWGSRGQVQAQSSLRRELTNLRRALNMGPHELLSADHHRVWFALDKLVVDARSADVVPSEFSAAFLEGMDIPGEEMFEDWLREQRQRLSLRHDRDAAGQVRLPKNIVDLSSPVPGFSGRPALAVLPLDNLTGSENLDYLADGISEELIERLSRLKWLPVIARSASFAYRSKPTALRDVGVSLGARYVLDGWLRQSEHCFHFGLDMADVETGYTVWSHKCDMPLQFTRETLDDLILEIVGVMDMRIDAAEKTRASRKSESALTVEDLIWRARWHLHRFTREDSLVAEKLFREALSLAPNEPEPLVQMTFFYARSIWTERKSDADMRQLRQWARRAIVADSGDGRGYMYAGMAELWMRRTSLALPLFVKAVELNPSLSLAHAQIGSAYILAGNPELAIAPLQMALRLGPNDEHTFYVLGELSMAHSMLGNWDLAVAHADQSLIRRVAYWYAHTLKINALARQGMLSEARWAVSDLHAAKPDFAVKAIDWLPYIDRKWNDFIREGLVMAGMS